MSADEPLDEQHAGAGRSGGTGRQEQPRGRDLAPVPLRRVLNPHEFIGTKATDANISTDQSCGEARPRGGAGGGCVGG